MVKSSCCILKKHIITKKALCSSASQEELKSSAALNLSEAADEHALVALLKSYAQQKDFSKGIELHAEVARKEVLEKNVFVGTSLVSLYAKCGALAKAQETFDELPIQNVVAWNALIAGYTQHGQGEHALHCLKQMQSGHISPNVITFVSIVKACGSIGAEGKGQEIHVEIAIEGLLEEHIVLGNALVDMYIKCGMLVEAQDLFDELPRRDDVSWNTLIAGYAQHEHGLEALEYFDCMQQDGHSPDEFTFACILKACGNIGASNKGQKIHAHIVIDVFLETNIGIGTALVDMYAKCAMLAEAQDVFDDLPCPNVVTWTALIAGYAQHGHGEEALEQANKMQREAVTPDAFTFVYILKACSSIGAAYKGQETHVDIARHGLLGKKPVAVALIDMYAKCGSFGKAHEVNNRDFCRDVVSWTALISGYVHHGLGEEALKYYSQMECEGVSSNLATIICILKACGGMGALHKGKIIHSGIAIENLMEKDVGIASALIDMYAKCGFLPMAQKVFDSVASWNRNEVLWNTLVAGYAQQAHAEEALNCFEFMKHEKSCPNAITYICTLKACGNAGAAQRGQELHADIVALGLLENHNMVANALVDMYARSGMLAEAQTTFDKLPDRDAVSWNVLVAGYSQQGHAEEVLKCYKQMRVEDFSLDVYSFPCVLKACGSLGAAYIGQLIHGAIIREGGLLETDMVIETALVDMYCRCSMLEEAQEVYDQIQVWNIASWNAMMAGYTQVGHDKCVLNSFDKLIEERKDPDPITLSLFLNACTNTGLLDHGQVGFETMSSKFVMTPSLEHHTCMVDLFCRAGRVDKAAVVIEEMPFLVNLPAWHTLLSACQNCNNLELGKWAFEHATELDQKDGASYVCMSNIYVKT